MHRRIATRKFVTSFANAVKNKSNQLDFPGGVIMKMLPSFQLKIQILCRKKTSIRVLLHERFMMAKAEEFCKKRGI
ncbi:hypothetical protein [Undibacterium sp. TJN19]|uniref:hypothetical protein n=1 Tax=Undibacterium sp. TJN19 TaxID=3413055 RepID=UPI003BF5EE2D